MKLSAAHSFVRWEGAPLTPLQEQVIDALERQRVLTGRVRAVVHVTDATDWDIEWILLRYTHYLHHTFTPRGRILVVDTNTRIASARYNGAAPSLRHFVLCRGGSRRFGTRGYGTVEQARPYLRRAPPSRLPPRLLPLLPARALARPRHHLHHPRHPPRTLPARDPPHRAPPLAPPRPHKAKAPSLSSPAKAAK